DFLEAKATEFLCRKEVMLFVAAGKFEDAATTLCEHAVPRAFEAAIRDTFYDAAWNGLQFSSALCEIVELARNRPVFTTNFDNVLFCVFKDRKAPFTDTVFGSDMKPALEALRNGSHCLVKIHGDCKNE